MNKNSPTNSFNEIFCEKWSEGQDSNFLSITSIFQEPNRKFDSQAQNKLLCVETKNVCYNICQRTVKVIEDKMYHEVVKELCQMYNFNSEKFCFQISKKKHFLSGPTALKSFISDRTILSEIFAKFMRWFLQNRYIRYALNSGQMKNIETYISYKNQVMMLLLPE